MQIHTLKGYIQTIYLVEYDHGILLLDGCSRPDVTRIKKFITGTLNRPISDLKLVVVTHMHPDHAGAAHTLRKQTGCNIASANVDHSWYSGLQGKLMYLTDVILTQYVAKRLGRKFKSVLYSMNLKPTHKLEDGDALPDFPEWKVLETPGHTDRDLSIIHEPSHRIYVADLIVKVKRKFFPPVPIFHPNKYRKSINHVIEMKPKSLFLAHGGEVFLTEEEFQRVKDSAPNKPLTHWRVAKIKIKMALQRN